MKKIILVLSMVLVLGLGTMFVYAETTVDPEVQAWHQERMEYKRADLDKALADGEITDIEYETWSDHYDYMDKFHAENGYLNKSGFGCHGGRGFGGNGSGRGMMRNGNGGWNN